MIVINEKIKIFENKIKFQAVRSGGPGGQHVNKVSTAVILKYNLTEHEYPDWFLKALKRNISRTQLSNQKVITIRSSKHKSQKRNKEESINKLVKIFKKSCMPSKNRIKTRPSIKSKEKRLLAKKMNSKKKDLRKKPNINE